VLVRSPGVHDALAVPIALVREREFHVAERRTEQRVVHERVVVARREGLAASIAVAVAVASLISPKMLGGASQTVSKIRVECNGT
jgi:hypothetical protein